MTDTTTLGAHAHGTTVPAMGVGAPAVVVGSLAVFALVVLGVPPLLAAPMLPAVLAARVDLLAQRLPDVWVGLTAAVTLVGVAVHAGAPGLAVGLAAAGFACAALLALHLANPSALGFGDVKFAAASAPIPAATAAAAGGTSGPLGTAALTTATALCIASGLAVVVGVARRRTEHRSTSWWSPTPIWCVARSTPPGCSHRARRWRRCGRRCGGSLAPRSKAPRTSGRMPKASPPIWC